MGKSASTCVGCDTPKVAGGSHVKIYEMGVVLAISILALCFVLCYTKQ